MRSLVSAFVPALLLTAAASAEEGLKSGNPVGQPIGGIFSIRCVSGPNEGQTYCQI